MRASRRNPRRPPNRICSCRRQERWVSRSPPGYTRTSAPAARMASPACGPAVTIPHFFPIRPTTGNVVTSEWASAKMGRSIPKYVLNASMNTMLSGLMFPPEWLPTNSTGLSSGTRSIPRTSARKYRVESSHISGSWLRFADAEDNAGR